MDTASYNNKETMANKQYRLIMDFQWSLFVLSYFSSMIIENNQLYAYAMTRLSSKTSSIPFRRRVKSLIDIVDPIS